MPLTVIEATRHNRHSDFKNALAIAAQHDGASVVTNYFNIDELSAMQREVVRAKHIKRNIADWHNTSRATFFGERDSRTLGRAVASRVLTFERFVPQTARIVHGLTTNIRTYGATVGCRSLASYTPNRIGINFLHGTAKDPAVIPLRIDVAEESGVVMAIEMGDGESLDTPVGSITLLLGKNTCHSFGIAQHPHEVVATTKRFGITVAQLL